MTLEVFYQKLDFSLSTIFGKLKGRIFPQMQPLIDLPVSDAPVKSLKKSSVYCLELFAQMHLKPTPL